MSFVRVYFCFTETKRTFSHIFKKQNQANRKPPKPTRHTGPKPQTVPIKEKITEKRDRGDIQVNIKVHEHL